MSSGVPAVVGVDLGTTYTCAAVADVPTTPPRVVQLTGTSQTIPSVVSLLDDGDVVAGEAAERRLVTHPSATAREFKRRLGDATPMVLGSTAVSAEELTGHLLREVLTRVERSEGGTPATVGLAHPASWGPFRLDLLRDAARLAGVDDVVLVPEPVAAAVAARDRVEPGSLVAVYDLGGGTFDAAVVRMDDEVTVVGTPEGVERLGGIDFDQAVMAHVDGVTGGQVFGLDRSDPDARGALMRLRAECQSAKEHLSQDADVDIPVALPGLQTTVRMTRAELEAAVRPRLADSLAVFDRVVASAGVTWDDIGAVLLVGGSSNMPVVAQLVGEHTGRPVVTATSPHLAIAIGTAAVAARHARPEPTAASPSLTSSPATGVVADAPAVPAARSGAGRLIAGLIAAAVVIGIVAFVVFGGGGDDEDTDADDGAVATSDVDGTEPTEPESTEPETTEPTEPETSEPETTEPESTEPETSEPDAPELGPVVASPCVAAPDDTVAVLPTSSGTVIVDAAGARVLDGVDATGCDFDAAGGDALALPVAGTPTAAMAFDTIIAVVTDSGGVIGSTDSLQFRSCELIDSSGAVNDGGVVFPIRDGVTGRVRTQGGDCQEQDAGRLDDIDATAIGIARSDRIAVGGTLDGSPVVRIFTSPEVAVEIGDADLPGLVGIDAIVRCGGAWCVVDLVGGSIHAVTSDGAPLGSSPVTGTPLEGATRIRSAVPSPSGPGVLTVDGSDGSVVVVTVTT